MFDKLIVINYNPIMKLKRYELKTSRGAKITWATNKSQAIKKATTKGFKVLSVKVKEIDLNGLRK